MEFSEDVLNEGLMSVIRGAFADEELVDGDGGFMISTSLLCRECRGSANSRSPCITCTKVSPLQNLGERKDGNSYSLVM